MKTEKQKLTLKLTGNRLIEKESKVLILYASILIMITQNRNLSQF